MKSNIKPSVTRTYGYRDKHDIFFPKDVKPPKPWFTKQFKLGFQYGFIVGLIPSLIWIISTQLYGN